MSIVGNAGRVHRELCLRVVECPPITGKEWGNRGDLVLVIVK